jgi:DNA-binding NarL/FixJ family response regulator
MLPVRILLVDDSPEFLEAATRFLSTDPQIAIAGRALSGVEAMEQVTRVHPDLVLIDWEMPGMSGLETTHNIKARPDAPSVIILTLHDNVEYRAAAQAAGADGYVTKSDFGTELLPCIHALLDGSVSVGALSPRTRELDSGEKHQWRTRAMM